MTDELADLLRALEDDRPPLDDGVIEAGIRAGRRSQQRHRRRTSVVAAAVSVAAVVGVAAWASRPDDRASVPEPARGLSEIVQVTSDGDPLLSCGDDQGWPASVMADGRPGLMTDADARRTFQRMLDDPRTAPEAVYLFPDGVDAVEWRALAGDASRLTLGLGRWTELGPDGDDARYLSLQRKGDHWDAVGWGSCALLGPVLLPGLDWAQLKRQDASPASTSVTIRVSECRGRDLGPILKEPVIEERPDAVVVYWTVTAVDGPAAELACKLIPTVDRTVRLDSPLGDRPLLDGSVYPPAPVTR